MSDTTEQITKTAEKLVSAGIVPGDRVAILSANSCKYAVLIAACWQTGAVVAPINLRYPPGNIHAILKEINCRKLFVSSDFKETRFDGQLFSIDEFVISKDNEFTPTPLDTMQTDLDADASVIFTSGSSGHSKAVLHSMANHYFSALGAGENISFAKADRWLMSLPMYHISGLSLVMRSLIKSGTIVFPSLAESINQSIMHRRITHLSLVPLQLSRLLDDAECTDTLKKLKAILIGGSGVNSAIIERALDAGLAIHTTYGSTETASQVATTETDDLKEFTSTCGKLLPHRQVKISQDGEILVKGKTLFRGYVSGDSITLPIDQQGYFASNDLGYFDEAGNLYVTGRKDRMFISGGENIYPEQIERAIEEIENVERSVVVAVDREGFGKRPVAFIRTKNSNNLDPDTLENALRKKIEGFMIPIAFFPWPKAEQDSIKKPDRKSLQNRANKLISQKTAD